MFKSEICVFFDSEYLKRMFTRNGQFEQTSLLDKSIKDTGLNLDIPSSMVCTGLHYKYDDGDPEYTVETEWWIFYEKQATSMMTDILKDIPTQST